MPKTPSPRPQIAPLFQPLTLGELEVPNRIFLAPMTRARAIGGLPGELMATYYAQRAAAGLEIAEAASVSPQGVGWVNAPGIYTDEQEQGWRQVTQAVHGAGGRIFLQLWHCGRASHSAFHGGELPVAPSAIPIEGDGVNTPEGKKPHETPRALETEELAGITRDYVLAARRARAAGFDGVEVHAANGYLLDQFLQSRTNHRSDGYGGDPAGRFRLLGEIVTGIRDEIGAGRLAVRLSPNGVFNDMGSPDYRETFTHVARELDRFGLAYLHVVDGLGFGFHGLGEPMTLQEFRSVFNGPLVGNCGYDADTAAQAVRSGHADAIAFGRPFIGNPDLVERIRYDLPLADSDMATWYASESGAQGYTDYPTHEAVHPADRA